MQREAEAALAGLAVANGASICLFDPGWHAGIVGLLAGRIKDQHHRPTIVFAADDSGLLKGSGRSIAGLHLRDALDLIDRRHPGMIARFGGHAAAAGLSLPAEQVDAFASAFEQVCREQLDPASLARVIETDGELAPADCTLDAVRQLEQLVWGQGFPAPAFDGEFAVLEQRALNGGHLKLWLQHGQERREAILFGQAEPLPAHIRAVFTPSINEWNGRSSVQLQVQHWEPVK